MGRQDRAGGEPLDRKEPAAGAQAPQPEHAADGRPAAGLGPGARPTMRDVARRAGVSLKTVSRVVNQEPNVAPDMRRRVEGAVTAMRFRPNSVARSLRTGTGVRTIGLVIADMSNPFYAAVARSVEVVASRHHAALIIASSAEEPTRERQLVSDLLHRPVDGLIVVPAGDDHRYLQSRLRLGAQVVFLDRPAGRIDADAVVLDNVAGACQAVEHLITHGHRRIGFVGDSATIPTAQERLEGYRCALEAGGIGFDPALVRLGAPRVEPAEQATRELLGLDPPVTAVFAANNRICVGALRAVRAVARPVAVVGFDDFELADMLPIPVTVIAHAAADLGRAAAELLFSRLAGDTRPPQRIVIPVRLVPRGTGEIPGPAGAGLS